MIKLEVDGFELCIEQFAPDQYKAFVNDERGRTIWQGIRHVKYKAAELEGLKIVEKRRYVATTNH